MARHRSERDLPPQPSAGTGPPADVARCAGRCPRSLVVFIVCTGAVVTADLTFKAWAFRHVADEAVVLDRRHPDDLVPRHEAWVLVPSILSLHLSTNTGAVFGLGRGNQGLLAVVSIAATVAIAWVFVRTSAGAWATHVALALLLSGALGNLYDRFRFGAVRDMLWLFPGVELPFGWAWPGGGEQRRQLYPWLFNIADAALVVGVILLLILMWQADRRQRAAQASAQSAPG